MRCSLLLVGLSACRTVRDTLRSGPVGISDYPGSKNDLPQSTRDVALFRQMLVERLGLSECDRGSRDRRAYVQTPKAEGRSTSLTLADFFSAR